MTRRASRFLTTRFVFPIWFLTTVLGAPASAVAANLLAGFTETTVASGLSRPTAMALAPDGRIFICEQGGTLRVVENGKLLATPFVTLNVDSGGERGLLGVAFDPEFGTTGFVYVYYTVPGSPAHNRVSRFTASGNVALPGSEHTILELESLSLTALNHNGGAIHFGPDGKLYVAVGENAKTDNSQTLTNRLGKILRVNRDGSIPNDNPAAFDGIVGTPQGDNRAIWAVGLRNPFTFAFHPLTGLMAINDVGANTWEEINVGAPGRNYGWPASEGPVAGNPAFTPPVYAYPHESECAISGGAFYAPAHPTFPAEYVNTYFFADLCGGWIHRIDTNGNVTEFATNISSPVDLAVADDGALYYLAGASSSAGVLRRVQYSAPQPAPPALLAFTNGLTLTLWWSASPGATSYVLEGGSGPGQVDLLNANIGNVTRVEGVIPADTYYARVRAVNGSSVSEPSNEVVVTLSGTAPCVSPPPAPTGFTARTSGLDVALSWDPSPSATGYVLEAGDVEGASNVAIANLGLVTSFATSAPPNTYFTRVRAVNACGASAPSGEAQVTLGCSMSPPAGLTATPSGQRVTFSWTPAPGATSYIAQVGTDSGLANLVNTDIGSATAQTVDISGVASGTYYVRILAVTACGITPASNEVTVNVP